MAWYTFVTYRKKYRKRDRENGKNREREGRRGEREGRRAEGGLH